MNSRCDGMSVVAVAAVGSVLRYEVYAECVAAIPDLDLVLDTVAQGA